MAYAMTLVFLLPPPCYDYPVSSSCSTVLVVWECCWQSVVKHAWIAVPCKMLPGVNVSPLSPHLTTVLVSSNGVSPVHPRHVVQTSYSCRPNVCCSTGLLQNRLKALIKNTLLEAMACTTLSLWLRLSCDVSCLYVRTCWRRCVMDDSVMVQLSVCVCVWLGDVDTSVWRVFSSAAHWTAAWRRHRYAILVCLTLALRLHCLCLCLSVPATCSLDT